MRVRKTKGRRGSSSTGGSRARERPEQEGRRAAYEAPPSVLALLRGTWAKRQHLTEREREAIFSMLTRAQTAPLSEKQIDYAQTIGKGVGVGYDDPAFDAASVIGPAKQPWGPLPLKPPGR